MSVCTALVVQNTIGVQDIVPTSTEFVVEQVSRPFLRLRMTYLNIATY